ncbi:MAG: Hsp20/alpha crystallin family protein [Candidatus Omnitrophica bacterium]|nr:Hsp20/alpha crystallin family protein [Candidatus Omnitrophota bacterium]MCM8768308.1 Hsp20/alpha crystallin family protein [Candidatus Omnitrophota bacterium]
MKMVKVDPFREIMDVRDSFDRFVDNFLGRSSLWGLEEWRPAVDIYEDEDNIVLRASIPGVKKDNIKITLTGDTVTLSGKSEETKEVKRDNYYRKEIRTGSFTRSFSLPCPVDRSKVSANYKDGILEVTLPKAEEAKAKEVQIAVK